MEDQVSLGERGRRRALNEALFREVNDRLAAMNATFSEFTEEFVVACECDELGCAQQIRLRPEEYEAVRRDPALFVVVPGHDSPDVENVVDRRGVYDVVRKKAGDPRKLATETDPRS